MQLIQYYIAKSISVIGLFFIVSTIANAQDIMVKKSGERFPAMILEVNSKTIKYLEFDNLESDLTKKVAIKDVLLIRYENGQIDIFDTSGVSSYVLQFLKLYTQPIKEEADTINHFKNLQEGGYISVEQFQHNAPKYTSTFHMSIRTEGEIMAWGGNDYMAKSEEGIPDKGTIKNDIWGLYRYDTLYLNALKLTGLMWYAKAEIKGKYCFLKVAYPIEPRIAKNLGLDYRPQIGFMFGIVGAVVDAYQALKRLGLIYSLETGEMMLLSRSNLLMLMATYPKLKAEFEAETKTSQNSPDTLLKYLVRLISLK